MSLTTHAEQGHQLTAHDAEQIKVTICVMRNREWLGDQWEFPGSTTLRRDQFEDCAGSFIRDDHGRKRDVVALVSVDGEPVFTLTRIRGDDGYRINDEGTRKAVAVTLNEKTGQPES